MYGAAFDPGTWSVAATALKEALGAMAATLVVGVCQYIHYYNHERIRTNLKGLSPVQYRNQALAT